MTGANERRRSSGAGLLFVHISVGGTTIRIQDGVSRELRDVLTGALEEIDKQSRLTMAPSFHLVPSLVAPPEDDELY